MAGCDPRGSEPIEIRRILPGDPADKQARFIEAAINGFIVACLYLPNGNPWPGPKFQYKLARAAYEQLVAQEWTDAGRARFPGERVYAFLGLSAQPVVARRRPAHQHVRLLTRKLMRALLSELGLEAWLQTSGGKGLHVVVPLAPRLEYEAVKAFSKAAVRHMAMVIPARFVAVAGGGNRVGKIFIAPKGKSQ